MNNKTISIPKITFFSALSIILIITLSLTIKTLTSNRYKVIIDNIKSCSQGISTTSKDLLGTQLYSYINSQNNITNTTNSNTYHATLRESSCKTKEFKDDKGVSYQTTAIIDFQSLLYSYKVTYNWTKNTNIPKELDLGSIALYCLPEQDLIYSNFDCESLPNIKTESDPILSALPYFNQYFSVIPTTSTDSTSGYGIIITYNPSEEVYLSGNTDTFEQETNQIIEQYFLENNIDLDNYTITKKYAIIE